MSARWTVRKISGSTAVMKRPEASLYWLPATPSSEPSLRRTASPQIPRSSPPPSTFRPLATVFLVWASVMSTVYMFSFASLITTKPRAFKMSSSPTNS